MKELHCCECGCGGNKKNNNPENLIPMCATHHVYWHSKHRHLIKDRVEKYRNEFIKTKKRKILYKKIIGGRKYE
jgi:hypothetical protein